MVWCGGACVRSNITHCGSACAQCRANEACRTGCERADVECGEAPILALSDATTTYAVGFAQSHPSGGTCLGVNAVWLAFRLVRTEIVFASAVHALIGLRAGSCALTAPVCGVACGDASQLTAVLDAGTHYLFVEDPLNGMTTTAQIRIQHIPVAPTSMRAPTPLPQGPFALTGDTRASMPAPGTCERGPAQMFYWTSCPASTGGTFAASSCGSSFAAALELRNGDAPADMHCANGGGGACDGGMGSLLNAPVSAGAGLHVLFVDGASAGTFVVNGTRP